MGATENKKYQDHRIIRGLFGTTKPNMRVHRPGKPLVATTNKEFRNQGFIRGVHGPVHATPHAGADRTMDIKPCGINHLIRNEGSPELADGTIHAFSGIKHSKAGYGIPSESKESNEVYELGVLVTRVINTDVDTGSQTSGPKTWRHEMRIVSRAGLFNNNEDTQDLCYPRLEDGPLPEHVGFQIEIPHWVEPQHSNSQLDGNVRSFTNIGDNSLPKIFTVVSAFKNPGVKNVKQQIDRAGFINGNGMEVCTTVEL